MILEATETQFYETPPQPRRFEVTPFIEKITPPLEGLKRDRAEYALTCFNEALDVLGYDGPMPRVIFSQDLSVDGVPRAAALIKKDGIYSLAVDLSDTNFHKAYALDEQRRLTETKGLPHSKLGELALLQCMFEEAFHLNDFRMGLIPPGQNSNRLGVFAPFTRAEVRAGRFIDNLENEHIKRMRESSAELYPELNN